MQTQTNRIREKTCNFREIQKQIIKSKQNQKGTSNSTINSLLHCVPNFIGCFAEDELSTMMFNSFPCFLIVNIDSSKMIGSHWLALGIFRNRIEIFDPLGFNFFNWSRVPWSMLKLLHRLWTQMSILRNSHMLLFVVKHIWLKKSKILCLILWNKSSAKLHRYKKKD